MLDILNICRFHGRVVLCTLDLLLIFFSPTEKVKEDNFSDSFNQRLDIMVVGHEYLKEKWLGASLSKTTHVAYLVSTGFVDSKAKRPSSVLEKGEDSVQSSRHGRTVVRRRYR